MTYYKYTNINGNTFYVKVIDGRDFHIPADEANTDYQKYLEWVAEGNEAEEWVAE
jgi:hypothetical protein